MASGVVRDVFILSVMSASGRWMRPGAQATIPQTRRMRAAPKQRPQAPRYRNLTRPFMDGVREHSIDSEEREQERSRKMADQDRLGRGHAACSQSDLES